ncbi:MAG TPA: hypothetical protein VMF58_05620 [Rhizomicrobium sp.]|nr:hypothetical protein [Rhizomicrobium sp.]
MMGNEPVMAHLPTLSLHILGGSIGILFGWAAVLAAKGERLHLLFGKIFLVGMALMALAAITLAIELTPLKKMEQANIGMGVVVLYLLSTSWMAVRQPPGTTGTFEKAALAVAVAASATFLFWGALARAPGGYDGYRASFYFVLGGVVALFAALDLRVILKGGVQGSARIARHLSRMCTAWFIASASFFFGQQKVMPEWVQGSKVLIALALAPLGFLIFWLIRVRIGSRFKRPTPATAVS